MRIALGLKKYLAEFARANMAESWKQFAGANPLLWQSRFLELMNDPETEIRFNLKGVIVWPGVQRASRGAGGATDWELLQISLNPEWWPRIVWLEDGETKPNPFLD